MAGYRPLRTATEVHDPLYLRCLLFKNKTSEEITAFITYDIIGVDHLLIDRIHKLLKENKTHIDHFVLSATHTHSGPAGVINTMKGPLKDMSEFFGTPSLPLINMIGDLTLQAIQESMQDWYEFRIETLQTTFNNIGTIRNKPDGSTDPHILLIRFLLDDEKQILLYHFACQASVLGESNIMASADFPSEVISHIRNQEMVMFINGNAGDINTKTITKEDSYEQLTEFGRQIAYEMKILLKHPDYSGGLERLDIENYSIDLLRKEVESKENMDEVFTIDYQIIRFNEMSIITLPVEMTSEVMAPLKSKYGVECFCYTNGYDLIMTSSESFDRNRYEALMSPFQKGEAEKLVQHIEEKI